MALSRVAARRLFRGGLVAAAGYYALWGGEYSAFDLQRLRLEREQEAERIAALRLEVDSLRAVAARLESDGPSIERVARERFGMIKDGEVLYRFIEVGPPAAPDTPDRDSAGAP